MRVTDKRPRSVSGQFNGRLDPAGDNADPAELPMGATCCVDRSGVIRYAHVDYDDGKRAEPADVVAALKGLGKAP